MLAEVVEFPDAVTTAEIFSSDSSTPASAQRSADSETTSSSFSEAVSPSKAAIVEWLASTESFLGEEWRKRELLLILGCGFHIGLPN